MKAYLNLGCGQRYHPSWTNVDFTACSNAVIAHDLRRGVPFANGQFDLVYHSHVLEHFSKVDALSFMKECHRVLKSKGVIRVAIPDLERIVQMYLQALEEAVQGSEQGQYNYEWMKLEIYDQTVREHPGGDMAVYLRSAALPNKDFVLERLGTEAMRNISVGAGKPFAVGGSTQRMRAPLTAVRRLYRFLLNPARIREIALRRFLGSEYELLQLGRFRRSGEIHLWMYDRYSLTQLMKHVGFSKPHTCGPTESQIPDWPSYHLDTEPDGSIYKPDSLYMEAIRA